MKHFTFFLAFVIVLGSCKKDPLNLEPISQISETQFYTSTEEMEWATIAIYDGWQDVPLREFALTEMRSDNARSNSGEGDWGQFDSWTVRPTNQQIGTYWTVNYNVIFRANRVLENLDAVDVSSLKLQFEGEAKFSRALAHFNLVRAYGDVPLMDREIGKDESEYFDRDPSAEVLAFIASDLEDAALLLPPKGSLVFGRATSEAASALLAKVYLTQGNYSGAEALLSGLIANTSYQLMEDYNDVFYSEGNDEIIFAIPYINDDGNESQDFSFEMTAGGVRSGLNYLTDDFVANMIPNDSERLPVIQNSSNPEENGKFMTTSADVRLCGNDWIVLRLADVYLLHVEAIMAGQLATQNLEAITSFNTIRGRVGLDSVAVDGTGEVTLGMLLNERRYELAFENHRFYDLVRTGQAQTVLSNFAASQGYNFSSTDLLLPLPQGEINVSGGLLTQNPGY